MDYNEVLAKKGLHPGDVVFYYPAFGHDVFPRKGEFLKFSNEWKGDNLPGFLVRDYETAAIWRVYHLIVPPAKNWVPSHHYLNNGYKGPSKIEFVREKEEEEKE